MKDINKDIEELEESIKEAYRCYDYDLDYDPLSKGIAEIIEHLIKAYKELEEYYEEQNEVNAKFIPKSKIKEFFTSRLEKYQEADDGAYEQDYLTRGELELVDRYKECKEIAKILLEEEIEAEIPQDCIPKSKVEEKIEELNKQYDFYNSDRRETKSIAKGYYIAIQKLEELLEKRK